MRASIASPLAIACNSLVTPDNAETTTSTRTPSSVMRLEARRPIVSQRLRRDTEVPPNLSTTQRVACATAHFLWCGVSGLITGETVRARGPGNT